MPDTGREDKGFTEAIRLAREDLERANRVEYLRSYIKEPLEKFRTLLLAGRNLFPSEIEDVVLLVIFIYIDLLGYLYKGKSSSKNAVQFLRDYLGQVDKRYEEVGGLLYVAFRHGYVHLATPKRIKLRDGNTLDFQFSRAKRREEHLNKMTRHEERGVVGIREIHCLSMDIDLLYEDLLFAVDRYEKIFAVIRNYRTLSGKHLR